MTSKNANRRRVFMVLSPRSLPYAQLALQSFIDKALEPTTLCLITDSTDDKNQLQDKAFELLSREVDKNRHAFEVYSESDLADFAADKFGRFQHLRMFRNGHPCWRKVTDPLLLTQDGEEMILLDPDIYFPNHFTFEQTPPSGIFLMWQKPSCLYPPSVVDRALNANIRLAHHVDIGVAQWRAPADLEWMDWLLGALGSPHLPRSMHIEAIVWSALAMRIGGGHLCPTQWICWHRTQFNRVAKKLGASGSFILGRERLSAAKCFHAGGEAKWWLQEAHVNNILDYNGEVVSSGGIKPFEEFTLKEFRNSERVKRWLKQLGYYSLFSEPGA